MNQKTLLTCGGQHWTADFGVFHNISDDSYKRGFAEGEKTGYAAGEKIGYTKGQTDGIVQGEQTEYDRFWDAYQQNGERTNYSYGFTGAGWTDETFKPKYPLRVVGNAESMFNQSYFTEIPVEVDFSQCNNIYYLFYNNNKLVRLPRMDISKVRTATYAFRECVSLEEIECLVFSENTTLASNTFHNTSNLKRLTVEGTINTALSFAQSSMLTNESVQSIIDHLKDLTGATAQTLTFHATVGAKLTDAQKATVTAKNWTLVY